MNGNEIRVARRSIDGIEGAMLAAWCSALVDGNERGQGTTEYAILVGVLVVMAIIAIALFRPRLQELWNSIAEGINSL